MVVLLLFALLSGALTAVTPCVLPVLPALLSAGATGGRRRPLGIVCGLAITFTITIAGVASLVDGVGVGDDTLRTIAIAFLVLFGLTLLVPRVGQRIEARLAFLSRLGPRQAGSGFWSGLPVGGALGLVYAPCAGPILAAVIAVSATRGATAEVVAVAAAYALGSAATLLLLALGGRRLMDRVRRAGRGPAVQQALGGVLIATALLMATGLDIEFQTALASQFPSALRNPTEALEKTGAVKDRLSAIRGRARFRSGAARRDRPLHVAAADGAGLPGVHTPALPRLGAAPEFAHTQRWFNSRPLTIRALKGRVVLIDFWTYTCINCIRTLPYLKAWDARYRSRGLTIVGVHTPEFGFERDAGNVAAAINREGLRYPVVQDNEYETWNAWGNQYWPTHFLVDASGQVRNTHIGEGGYDGTEAAIRALLAESGRRRLGAAARPGRHETPSGQVATPETYLGSARSQGSFSPVAPRDGTHDYRAAPPADLQRSAFSLGGRWAVDRESARAVGGATLSARVVAKAVYLVLSSPGDSPRRIRVDLDGKPIPARAAGEDVAGGVVTVRRQRLYRLVRLPKVEQHVLTLRLDPGIAGYAFTFG